MLTLLSLAVCLIRELVTGNEKPLCRGLAASLDIRSPYSSPWAFLPTKSLFSMPMPCLSFSDARNFHSASHVSVSLRVLLAPCVVLCVACFAPFLCISEPEQEHGPEERAVRGRSPLTSFCLVRRIRHSTTAQAIFSRSQPGRRGLVSTPLSLTLHLSPFLSLGDRQGFNWAVALVSVVPWTNHRPCSHAGARGKGVTLLCMHPDRLSCDANPAASFSTAKKRAPRPFDTAHT